MNSVDPRTPVLVGTGQLKQRPDNPLEALEPIAMMRVALEAAGSREELEQGLALRLLRSFHRRSCGELLAMPLRKPCGGGSQGRRFPCA